MNIDFQRRHTPAFGRVELFFCAGAVALLLAVALPALAISGRSSERLGCVDNLRQLGRAFHSWAFDHQDANPWTLPLSMGGTRPAAGTLTKAGNVWPEFVVASNELVTPALLVCPADPRKNANRASNWSNSSEGGYANSKFRNNATSYTIGLHSGIEIPRSLLSSDRNLQPDAIGQSCSYGINAGAASINAGGRRATVRWTNAVHGLSGNLLLNDGSVLQTSTDGLRDYFNFPALDNSAALHMLLP